MLGAPARILEIKAIADQHNIPVIEDSAQAAGARINGQHLGTFGACGTFSFDPVKTMTTGEGGMVICNDEELWRNMSEYHDHGHDHAVNPGGRGGEGRRFIGFNYRMMELQGAIGLAQLAKLDDIIARQRENKKIIKDAAAAIPGVSFRSLVDETGDSATFLAFMLPAAERAEAVNQVLSEHNAAAINFGANSWHFYPRWEHLAAGSTLCRNGQPFYDGDRRRVIYDPAVLPQSAAIMDRCLVYQIPIKLSDERRDEILNALSMAAAI